MENSRYSVSELQQMETITQSWDGAELKIETATERVWLNPRENWAYDGKITCELLVNGRWETISVV
jgi:hypothetical protein